MFEIMMPLGPPSSSGARKSPRLRTKAKVAPASTPGMESGKITLQKVCSGRCAQIVRGFHQIPRNVLERRIDRQKCERRVDVGERQHHGKRAIEQKLQRMLREVHILQQRVQHAVAAQDRFPGIGAHQIADPQRNDDQLIEADLFCLPAWNER